MSQQSNRTPFPHPRLAARAFSGEMVIVDPQQNVVRMLNEVGSRIWELADGTRTVEEIADILTGEYNVEQAQAHQSVEQFLHTLAERNLLLWKEE